MKVFNLWLNSSGPWWPHALHPWEMLPFFDEMMRVVSGLSHSGHRTNFRINPSNKSCNFDASWLPFTMKRSFLKSNCVWAPSSQPKYFVGSEKLFFQFKKFVNWSLHWKIKDYLQVGGRPNAFATSIMLTMTVLMPLPLPSTLAIIRGIL